MPSMVIMIIVNKR